MNLGWKKVVYAADCKQCKCCDDLICHACNEHYSDCNCFGPHQEGLDRMTIDGVQYARYCVDLKNPITLNVGLGIEVRDKNNDLVAISYPLVPPMTISLKDPEECECGRRKINHFTLGLICEDCEIKWKDPYENF